MSATVTRRTGILLAVALAVAATPVLADGKPDPASKIFPYLEKFLKVPAAERTRVRLSYALLQNGKPIPNLKGTLIEKGGERLPLTFNSEGYFERLPTLAQLDGGMVSFDLPDKAKVGLVMDISPALKPAAQYDVKALTETVNEANTVIGKAAGPLGMLAPKMAGVSFPKAEGGVAVFADGHTVPLPELKEGPYFPLDDFKGAVQVKLTRSPTKVRFYQGKK